MIGQPRQRAPEVAVGFAGRRVTCYTPSMAKPLTVRDLRLHWPEAERRLRREGELLVTRDGEPVAKLVAYKVEKVVRRKWSAQKHLQWLSRTWKSKPEGPSTDELLARDRNE